jgi:isoleucyl-tRNA synthetase
VETRQSIKKRTLELLEEMESKHKGKKILFVSHDGPLWMMTSVANGCDIEETLVLKPKGEVFMKNAELKPLEYKVIPRNEYGELDLHRPFIDEVYFDCSCGGKMQRVKEVMDVWFDSGSMPFAQDHYPFENKELIDSVSYPADYISEAIDQTRGWFYTLHAIGVLMGKGKAYRNVICLGHILDEKGKKMSKSIGNVVNPQEMMDKYCADALRFWMYSVNQPGDSKNFDEKTVDEVVKKVFNLITNVLSFYKLYDSGKNSKDARPKSQHVLDRWIMMKTDELIIKVTKGLDNYVFLEPTRSIREFIADLSQWYLRRSRDRFKTEGEDKEQVLITMKYVLTTLAKVMAPFTPFLSEYVYREIRGKLESVHLEDWPVAETVDAQLLQDMETVRILASKGLEARMKAGINVRQPLMSLKIKNSVVVDSDKLSNEFLEIIKDEVNVKEVLFDDTINGDVELDTNITPELKEEGMVREVIRAIQDLRKEAGLTVNDRVVLIVGTDEEGNNFVEKNKAEIMRVTLLKEIKFENQSQDISNNNIEIGDLKMKLGFNKE